MSDETWSLGAPDEFHCVPPTTLLSDCLVTLGCSGCWNVLPSSSGPSSLRRLRLRSSLWPEPLCESHKLSAGRCCHDSSLRNSAVTAAVPLAVTRGPGVGQRIHSLPAAKSPLPDGLSCASNMSRFHRAQGECYWESVLFLTQFLTLCCVFHLSQEDTIICSCRVSNQSCWVCGGDTKVFHCFLNKTWL